VFGGAQNMIWGAKANDVWEWDGATWTNRTPAAGAMPPVRYLHSMVYDSNRGVSIVFGGQTNPSVGLEDIWEWNNRTGTWAQVMPAAPGPFARWGHAATFDPARQRMIVYGAQLSDANIWEWDVPSRSWSSTLSFAVGSGAYSALTYVPARGRTLLYGGTGGGGNPPNNADRVVEWDGATVSFVTLGSPFPGMRYRHAMAYDSTRDRVFIFGGGPYATVPHELWEWNISPGRQSAIQLDAAIADDIPVASILGVSARAHCGGQGVATSGAVLFGWNSGSWQPLGSNGIGVPAPFPSDGSAVIPWPIGPTDTLAYVQPRDRMISLRCTPVDFAGPGIGIAKTAMDYIEVRVDYLAPNQ